MFGPGRPLRDGARDTRDVNNLQDHEGSTVFAHTSFVDCLEPIQRSRNVETLNSTLYIRLGDTSQTYPSFYPKSSEPLEFSNTRR